MTEWIEMHDEIMTKKPIILELQVLRDNLLKEKP